MDASTTSQSTSVSQTSCSDVVAENLRDVGSTCGAIRSGRLWRSSQFHSVESREVCGIASVLDLRRESRPCTSTSRVLMEVARPHWWFVRMKGAGYDAVGASTMTSCPNCEESVNKDACADARTKVYHVDMCTAGFKYHVFASLPAATRLSAVASILLCKSPSALICKAAADPSILGYARLYILFLEFSKPKVAKAFWVMAQPSSYPLLIHCIHGKDRTGLLVMLALRLCGASKEEIVNEYMMSSRTMSSWRLHGNGALESHLQTQEVLSVEREYMQAAIEHIDKAYGDVSKYLLSCGVTLERQEIVRNLLTAKTPALPAEEQTAIV